MTKRRGLSSLGLGLLISILGIAISFSPGTSDWEEAIGLGLLFQVRGHHPPPQDVVIVSINGETAAQLGLGEEIPDWPRSLHADLINRLTEAGAGVVAMDIFFKKPGIPEMDNRLADAIDSAGNVLLVAYLQQQAVESGVETLHIEKLLPPLDTLSASAAGLAPFVLPKIPVRVSRFWTFNGNDEMPSLPAVALQHHVDPEGRHIKQLLINAGLLPTDTDIEDIFKHIRSDQKIGSRLLKILQTDPPTEFTSSQLQGLTALLQLYVGDSYPYLNFYGPPGSIPTVPYQELLLADPEALHRFEDKVVFVGYAGAYQPRQKDGFYTVFTQENGLDLSGVEIAATAFANLLQRETLIPLSPGSLILLLVFYSFAIVLLFRYLPGTIGILLGLCTAALYLMLVYHLFEQYNLWLPWFVPLALQTPLALILSLTWHYRQMRISREQLRELFGYYLPNDVIDRLAQDKDQAMQQSEAAFGVCLASDAQQYTKLAETMEPQTLQVFLNRYYEILFTPVRSRGGVVSDVVGDAMLAIWPSTTPDQSLAQKACEAALDINLALEHADFEPKLFTRIGLHAGKLVMGHVGAIDHFEYRAVGDMVNTASRIENLNKLLGTAILASREAATGLQGIVTRELGDFPVPGRQQPITLLEVAASDVTVTPEMRALHISFAQALAYWHQGDKATACDKFEAILQDHPDDGPCIYYIQQYRERRSSRKNPLG
ncbi:MAG: adenylate/guanylate cyclase domain-containing protein [Candidatus Thiodiazotropha sp. (ex Myrtea sp. 'scaly one' KF741663)]|nr:adenylate/guanylate cyclase domain-containing protein [Candidatus Thiodiazotropha sp. (ex Myrtea sp. 'scaly one' KF741663)]